MTPRKVPAIGNTTRFSGLEPFEIGADTGFVMIGERTNVTGSKRFRRLIESDDYQAAVDVAARAGPRRREPARRQHGRRPARQRAGDDHVPEPDRHRARGRPHPDHGRQFQVDCPGGRAEVRAGQGSRQLHQPQGGRGALPRAGTADPQLRRGRGRDGLRREGPGRHRRPQGRDLRAAPTTCSPSRPASRPRTSCSTPTCSRSPPASPSTTATPRRSSTRCRGSRSAARARGPAAASRTCRSPSAATTSCARPCTRRSCCTPCAPGWTWASSTPASSRSTRTSPSRAAGARRGRAVRPARGRHRPAGRVRRERARVGHQARRSTCPGARRRWTSGSRTRCCTASSTSSRTTPRRPASRRSARSTSSRAR